MRQSTAKCVAPSHGGVAIAVALLMASPASDAMAQKRPKTDTITSSPSRTHPSIITREVLALYDSGAEATPDQTRLHKQLEMPFNHLGYTLIYHDIQQGLPSPDVMSKYAAVATWFGERIHNHTAYLKWAASVAARGTRFVVVDFVGAPLNGEDAKLVNAFLKHLGIQSHPVWIDDINTATIKIRDPSVVEFEHKLDGNVPGHMVFTAISGRATSHLMIENDGRAQRSRTTDAVITSSGGGFVQYGFGQIYDQKTERLKWVLNPFAFLERALNRNLWPIPDTTTIAGRRIYFSHIDGDGWNNISEFKDASGKAFLVSEIVRDKLIRAYPDLPVSVAPIACDMLPTLGGHPRASLIARELLQMRNIEVAAHTHSHPFNWGFFKNYSRADELKLHEARNGISNLDANQPGRELSPLRAGYGNNGPDMPRGNYIEPFNLQTEITGALEVATSLSPPNKKAALYLWSGNTAPFEAAVSTTRAAGVRNMNGGDTRLDTKFPSVSYVPPIARPVGKERQIHAVSSNENTYTSGWSSDFGAFATVAETWANTELPRRLKGTNTYYHMYSGQKQESLDAVASLLNKARADKVIPITASHYASVADSYFDVTIQQEANKTWRIFNRGALDTIRFDAANSVAIDLAQSNGVLGSTMHADSLYVALDPAVAEPTVALGPKALTQKFTPALVDSRWQISSLNRMSCGFKANAAGFGQGDMTWHGMYPGVYTVNVSKSDGTPLWSSDVTTNSDGELKLSLPVDAIESVTLTIECQEPTQIAETPLIEQPVTAPLVPNVHKAVQDRNPEPRARGSVNRSNKKTSTRGDQASSKPTPGPQSAPLSTQ
ncbi:MAG: hypothetical protein ABL898_02125 [Hyphomicrobiaceae bacterium]|nr:hypothetical protein [Hyphomicrobiaceae bacterium]